LKNKATELMKRAKTALCFLKNIEGTPGHMRKTGQRNLFK